MTQDNDEDKRLQFLEAGERYAYQIHCKSNDPEIATSTAEQFWELFKNGKDCNEIRRLNSGFRLGQIVHARVRDNWDIRRKEHQKRVQEEAPRNVLVTQLEAAEFVKDAIAAAMKLNTDSFKRYLQTSDEKHLEGTMLEKGMTFRQFKELLDLMATLVAPVPGPSKSTPAPAGPPDATTEAPASQEDLLENMVRQNKKAGR